MRRARQFTEDVEFSCEDASRSDPDFLCRVVQAAIEEGATTINLPDTVGYAMPAEYGAMFRDVLARVPGADRVTLSAHCHDDLGLAVANSLAAIAAGARQVECTVNGIGERAGNAALEEIVIASQVRGAALAVPAATWSRARSTAPASCSAYLTGVFPQPNKAIVGRNAFAHEAGIHQHGMLQNGLTYEIIRPGDGGHPALDPGPGQALGPARRWSGASAIWATTWARSSSTRSTASSSPSRTASARSSTRTCSRCCTTASTTRPRSTR